MSTLGSTLSTAELSGTTPDIPVSLRAPAVDETIAAGASAVIVRRFTVASGKKLVLGLAAILRIL